MKNHLSLVLIFIVSISFINAQWNSNVNINTPISLENGNQRDLRMESDGQGGAFITWKDYRNGLPDIFIQRVDSLGNTLWTIDGSEVCIHPSDQSTPAITTDEQGGVIVAWSDWRSQIERDLYAQRIDGDGNLLWQTDGAPVSIKIEREHSEKIISDDHSGVIIVWEQQRITDFTWDIWAQRIDSMGNPVWAVGGVPICLEGSNRRNHKIQRDGDGGVFITWQDLRSGDYNIYAQHLDSLGNMLWNNQGLLVCDAVGAQTNPKIDPEKKHDGIYITWVDKRNAIDYDIYSNRIDSVGNVLWGNSGKPIVTGIGNQSALDILSNNKIDGLIVTWKDKRSGNYDIYTQKVDIDGNPLWALNGLAVCTAINDQKNPNIISDKNGGAIIVWQDKRSSNWDVYCQRVAYNGNMIWQVDGEPICTAFGKQTSPKNIPDNKGGTIIAWEDRRTGFTRDIFAHHILFEDTVTYPVDTVIIPIDTIDTVSSIFNSYENTIVENAFPNPFKDYFVIDLENNLDVNIKVINVLGEEINNYKVSKTKNKLVFDMSDKLLAKGTYFVLLTTKTKSSIISIVKE